MKAIILIVLLMPLFSQIQSKNQNDLLDDYLSVNIQKLASGHDLVTVTINGQQGRFILDTGAVTTINDKLIEKYRLFKKIDTIKAAGAGGAIDIAFYQVGSLELGQTNIPINRIGVSDLNEVIGNIYNSTSILVDGIIGQDVLIKGHAIIDINGQSIHLAQTNQPNSQQFENELLKSGYKQIKLVPLIFDEHQFEFNGLPVKINGTERLLILDSGSIRTILNKEHLGNFSLKEKKGLYQQSSGAGGAFRIKRLDTVNIKIYEHFIDVNEIYSMDLSAVIKYIKAQIKIDVYGVIGQDILKKHSAIINPSKNIMYLKFL